MFARQALAASAKRASIPARCCCGIRLGSARSWQASPATSSSFIPIGRARKYRDQRRSYTDNATLSSQEQGSKPYYVTAPIFYVNAGPHIGHLYTLVLSDVLKRWQQLRGRNAKLCIGTDEHGMKVQQAAAMANTPPKAFCDKGAEQFKRLADLIGVKYDRFIRTTDEDHKDAVQHFWRLLRDRDLIYAGKHEGWYCVSDETFYPENGVERIVDPSTGNLVMTSKETGKTVEWTSETNYHFRLSALQPRLLEFYKENPNFIVPANRMKEVLNSVEGGLKDLSISRPRDRLSWGIPVPDDEEHTIYVWLDALINYVTAAGFPWAPGRESIGGWPADVHVIGKDIMRFHCVYWPAFLLALDIPPPKQVMAHSHWTMAHRKMAKSVGNVVNPFHSIQRYGIDPLRFYLCHDGSLATDTDYANETISTRYTKLLQSQLGNLLNRVCSKTLNLQRSILAGEKNNGWVDKDGSMQDEPLHLAQRDRVAKLAKEASISMDELDFSATLKSIFEVVAETHDFLAKTEPWMEKDEVKRDRMVYLSAEAVRICGILLQPFMPEKMEVLCNQLSISTDRRSFEHARLGADFTYGTESQGKRNLLFPPLIAPK